MIDDKTKVNEEVDFTGGKEPLSDQLVGSGEKPELSPNPLFSGYEHQVTFKVDLSIEDGGGNTTFMLEDYIDSSDSTYADPDGEGDNDWLPILPHTLFVFEFYDGEGKVADRKYYTVLNPSEGIGIPEEFIVQVYPDQPAVDARELHEYPKPVFKKGFSGTPVHENQAPKKRPQIFSDPVNFLEDVFIKGKPLKEYIDSQGGVTEEELQEALGTTAKVWITNEDFETLEQDTSGLLNKVKTGDIIFSGGYADIAFVTNASENDVTVGYTSADGVFYWNYVKTNNVWGMYGTSSTPLGTKLYKHVIKVTEYYFFDTTDPDKNDIDCTLITNNADILTFDDFIHAMANQRYISLIKATFSDYEYKDIHAMVVVNTNDGSRWRGYSFREQQYYTLNLDDSVSATCSSFSDNVTPLE